MSKSATQITFGNQILMNLCCLIYTQASCVQGVTKSSLPCNLRYFVSHRVYKVINSFVSRRFALWKHEVHNSDWRSCLLLSVQSNSMSFRVVFFYFYTDYQPFCICDKQCRLFYVCSNLVINFVFSMTITFSSYFYLRFNLYFAVISMH